MNRFFPAVILLTFLFILGSCRKDKSDILEPLDSTSSADYRDSILGNYDFRIVQTTSVSIPGDTSFTNKDTSYYSGYVDYGFSSNTLFIRYNVDNGNSGCHDGFTLEPEMNMDGSLQLPCYSGSTQLFGGSVSDSSVNFYIGWFSPVGTSVKHVSGSKI